MQNDLEAFIRYLQVEKNVSTHTCMAYHKDITQLCHFLVDNYECSEWSQAKAPLIRDWMVDLVDEGVSNRSINRKKSSINTFFKFLLRSKQVESNPVALLPALKSPKKIRIPFSQNEIHNTLEEARFSDTFDSLRDRLIIELLYATGMRRSELIHLQSSNIDWAQSQIKILGKGNKERMIPIVPNVLDLMKRYFKQRSQIKTIESEDYFLLKSNGVKLSESFVYRTINSYFSTTTNKVQKSPHVLRHSFATHLLEEGVNLQAVKELLGHESLAATQVYTHQELKVLLEVHKKSHPRNR